MSDSRNSEWKERCISSKQQKIELCLLVEKVDLKKTTSKAWSENTELFNRAPNNEEWLPMGAVQSEFALSDVTLNSSH